MTDPISDMLTRIRNALSAKHVRVDMPASKLKAELARILQDEGYIQGFQIIEEPGLKKNSQLQQVMRIFLKYSVLLQAFSGSVDLASVCTLG